MKRLVLSAMLCATLAGCGRGQTPEEKERADARDVEFVEAAQDRTSPIEELDPQAISAADIASSDMGTPRCRFFPASGPGPILLVMVDTVYLKLDGGLRVLAADRGSREQASGGWTRYEGREYVIDVQIVDESETESADQDREWSGRVTIRDGSDSVLYTRAGTLRCGG